MATAAPAPTTSVLWSRLDNHERLSQTIKQMSTELKVAQVASSQATLTADQVSRCRQILADLNVYIEPVFNLTSLAIFFESNFFEYTDELKAVDHVIATFRDDIVFAAALSLADSRGMITGEEEVSASFIPSNWAQPGQTKYVLGYLKSCKDAKEKIDRGQIQSLYSSIRRHLEPMRAIIQCRTFNQDFCTAVKHLIPKVQPVELTDEKITNLFKAISATLPSAPSTPAKPASERTRLRTGEEPSGTCDSCRLL